jgi:hypothetical protein
METHSTADDHNEVPRNDDLAGAPARAETDGQLHAAEPTGVQESGDDLATMAARAKSGRLTAAEEERVIALLKQSMLEGKNGVARVVEALPNFSWLVAVRGIESVWSEIKPAARAQFVKALAEQETEAARRIRLSLARALFKQDVPVALKIAGAVAKEMVKTGGETIAANDAHIFSNVFIGKAKPWIAQLSLAELKPADADALVQCALSGAFAVPHPPPTQLGVLKWANETGRLEKLEAHVFASVVAVVSRWSAKWRAALIKELDPLPEVIAAAIRKESTAGTTRAEDAEEATEPRALKGNDAEEGERPVAEPATGKPERKERPVYQPRPQKTGSASPTERPAEGARERPVYQPRNAGGGAARDLNVTEVLRQIEAHVTWLRSELQSAQAKLREENRQTSRRGKAPDRVGDVTEAGATFEELARTNAQLEARIAELQTRIADLLADAEDRAASMRSSNGEEGSSQDAQLRALLGLKLQESYADFSALEKESPSIVVQQHYRSLLQEVFAVLRGEGVPLDERRA